MISVLGHFAYRALPKQNPRIGVSRERALYAGTPGSCSFKDWGGLDNEEFKG